MSGSFVGSRSRPKTFSAPSKVFEEWKMFCRTICLTSLLGRVLGGRWGGWEGWVSGLDLEVSVLRAACSSHALLIVNGHILAQV